MCSFNCVPSLLLIGVKDLRCVACFFVRTLFHCFVCALVADPRIGRTLVVSFDILRRLRLVTALSLRSYKTNVSGCGGGGRTQWQEHQPDGDLWWECPNVQLMAVVLM